MKPAVLVMALAMVSSSCGGADESVYVLAAASLIDVATDLEAAFEQQHRGVDVVVNSAGSNALAELINGGTDVDVFLPASRSVLDQLDDPYTDRGTVASNSLIIAVPAGNPAGIDSLTDLENPDLVIAICAPGVPCGDATALLPVTISADTMETNVRQVAAKVASGEVDAGVVYASDVLVVKGIDAVPIRPETVVVDIPAITFATSDLIDDFIALLESPSGRDAFQRRGFGVGS